jgi:hypothetical protein
MRHTKGISRIPACAQTTAPTTGLCTNVVDSLQARFCFILAFLTDVFVPLVQPFVNLKAGTNSSGDTTT